METAGTLGAKAKKPASAVLYLHSVATCRQPSHTPRLLFQGSDANHRLVHARADLGRA